MGYLVCYSCGGYYHLQPGESPNKYNKCACGGKLKYYPEIELPNCENENKVGVLRRKIKPKGYKEKPEETLREKLRLQAVMNGLRGSISENTEIKWGLKNRILFDGFTFIAVSILFIPAMGFSFIFPVIAMAIIASSSALIIISQKKIYNRNRLRGFYLLNAAIFGLSCFISILFLISIFLQLNPLIYNAIDYSYFSSTWIYSPITLAVISGFSCYWSLNRAALPDYDEKQSMNIIEPAWRGGGWK